MRESVTRKHDKKNRIRSQTSIFIAEQEAIIKAIYISKGKSAIVIATDSFSSPWQLKVRDGQKTHDQEKKESN
jgi:hypothetical protein